MKDYLAITAIFWTFGAALLAVIYLSGMKTANEHTFGNASFVESLPNGTR